MHLRNAYVLAAFVVTQYALAQTVCIDPGHPSEVGLGTRGKKITEVAFAWEIAKRTKKRLEAAGIKVVLTKDSELQMVPNRTRAETANKAKADLMVRLHCDASTESGYAVYYPAQVGTAANGTKGPAVDILKRSEEAAQIFYQTYTKALNGKLQSNGLRTDKQTAVGARQGALTGSIFSQVPVLLVEMLVLTNPSDESFAASDVGKEILSKALTQAVLAVVKPN
jgi:N-acetylmuramoyl-L-alanine amidase